MNIRLSGIIVATVLPFKESLDIDEESYRQYLRYLVSSGVNGLYCNGHAGDVSKLSRDECKRVVQITAEEAHKNSLPVLAGILSDYTVEAMHRARDAEEAGADVALILPPYHMYGAMSGAHIDIDGSIAYKHHKSIADSVTIPLMLFKYPTKSNISYTRKGLEKLLEIEKIIAIKMTNFDLHDFQEDYNLVRKLRQDVSIMTADDILLSLALIMGADGASAGICNIAPDLWVKIYKLVKSGNLKEALQLQNQFYPIMKATHDPLMQHSVRIKLVLHELGLLNNPVVRGPPYLDNTDLDIVRNALERTPILKKETTVKNK